MYFFFAQVSHEAHEAHEAVHHADPDLVSTLLNPANNVLNWLLLIGLIVYGWNKLVPPMLEKRARAIELQIKSAEEARATSEAFLKKQEAALENASKESSKLVDEAKVIAAQMKVDIEKQAEQEVVSLDKKFDAAVENQRQMVVTEMRTAAAKAAVQLARTYLAENVNEANRKKLLTQFMQQLDTLDTAEGESFAPQVGSTLS